MIPVRENSEVVMIYPDQFGFIWPSDPIRQVGFVGVKKHRSMPSRCIAIEDVGLEDTINFQRPVLRTSQDYLDISETCGSNGRWTHKFAMSSCLDISKIF